MAQMFLRSTGKNSNHVSCCTLQPISKPFKNLQNWIANKLARPTTIKRCHVSLSIWGCIETWHIWHAIFGRMNIQKSQLCWCLPRYYCFDSKKNIFVVVECHRNQQQLSRNPYVLWHCILDVVVFLFMCHFLCKISSWSSWSSNIWSRMLQHVSGAIPWFFPRLLVWFGHQNPSKSIKIHQKIHQNQNPSKSIKIHQNPSKSIKIHQNPNLQPPKNPPFDPCSPVERFSGTSIATSVPKNDIHQQCGMVETL